MWNYVSYYNFLLPVLGIFSQLLAVKLHQPFTQMYIICCHVGGNGWKFAVSVSLEYFIELVFKPMFSVLAECNEYITSKFRNCLSCRIYVTKQKLIVVMQLLEAHMYQLYIASKYFLAYSCCQSSRATNTTYLDSRNSKYQTRF